MSEISFSQAINDAIATCMEKDQNVFVLGLGVRDPKGVFGTTIGLEKKFGSQRVVEMPTAENSLTGFALGASLMGMRPIMVHQRVEFSLLAIDQIVNQAAKWSYQTGGKMNVPMVIRLIIGRGWGQGPQHSQSLESWFAHIPGLKVVMPSTPQDAKGLMISSVRDNNPVIFFEHRWLHDVKGIVSKHDPKVEIGKCKVVQEGNDLTIVAYSFMVNQALYCASLLKFEGFSAEVVDVRSLRPLDENTILQSVSKTGRLLVLDLGWSKFGVGGEIITSVVTKIFDSLIVAPIRVGIKDVPIPSTQALANIVYPSIREIITACEKLLNRKLPIDEKHILKTSDVPNEVFQGPF